MTDVPGATPATQTANPVTAVVQGAQMRTLVLDPVSARCVVYSSNVHCRDTRSFSFVLCSAMSVDIKQIVTTSPINIHYFIFGTHVLYNQVYCCKTPPICLKTYTPEGQVTLRIGDIL